MLTEAEFEEIVRSECRGLELGCRVPDIISHDRDLRAEIARLRCLDADWSRMHRAAKKAEAERDRYLAAMRDAVRAYDRLEKGGYGGDLAVAWATLRAIVEEEASRG